MVLFEGFGQVFRISKGFERCRSVFVSGFGNVIYFLVGFLHVFIASSKALYTLWSLHKRRAKLEGSGALFKFRVCCSGALTVAVLQSRNLGIFWCIVGHLVI